MKLVLILSLLGSAACSSLKPIPLKVDNTCHASREFITTMEYLKTQTMFALNEQQSRDVAHEVSSGCTGASKRFIQVTNLLIKSGLPSQTAITTGRNYAKGDDDSYHAFMTIFKSSYLESLLDLDMKQSLDMANELSLSFKGDRKIVEKEFSRLVDFCVSSKSLQLPLLECAHVAARVVKSGEEFKHPIGADFLEVVKFVTNDKKSNLPTFEALKIAEHVVKFGPEAKKNFFESYEYAVDKKGLDYTVKDAIEFAKTMASRSIKKIN